MKKFVTFLFTFLIYSNPLLHASWTQGQQKFTAHFYPHAKEKNSNLVFSPLSLQLALAMASEIAYGKTQEEMLKISSLPRNKDKRREEAIRFLNRIQNNSSEKEMQFLLANGGWIASQLGIPSQLNKILLPSYQMEIHYADFLQQPEEMRFKINSWVEEKTKDKIQNLLPENSISQQTVFVLVNTLYMLAPWKSPFNPKMTFQGLFYQSDCLVHSVTFMRQEGRFGYLEKEDHVVIELPFKESSTYSLALTLVMPVKGTPLEALEKELSGKGLDQWINGIEYAQVDLVLPKFKIESQLDAKAILQSMGMKKPFSFVEAEFDLGSEKGNIAISEIVHKAVFEIDELGGTGAAATGIVMNLKCCIDKKKVVVDHPFLIFVTDKSNGLILFAGKVVNP